MSTPKFGFEPKYPNGLPRECLYCHGHDCPECDGTPNTREWEKEFDKKFVNNYAYGYTVDPNGQLVKDFIYQELQKARAGVRLSEHRERLALWNEAVEEGRRRERGFIKKLIDGNKVVYAPGDERFYPEAKDGEEKEHIDSCCNETIDEILQALDQSELDQPTV